MNAELLLSIAAIVVSLLGATATAAWNIAKKTSLSRTDLDAVVASLTARMDALLDKLNIIATNSVTRAEFSDELHILRKKITEHVSDHSIHVNPAK